MRANDLTLYDQLDWWDDRSTLALLRKLNPGRFAYFGKRITSWNELSVLDAGCGGGFSSEYLAQRGARVTGVDQSELAIRAAREHAAAEGLHSISYKVGSITNLPCESGTFDAIVCVDVLEHVADWTKALAEFHRVLRPGGSLFFDTINRNLLSRIVFVPVLERALKVIARGTHDPRLFIKPDEMHRGLHESGFRNIHSTGFHVIWSPLHRQVKSFAGGPRALMYIGSATKEG